MVGTTVTKVHVEQPKEADDVVRALASKNAQGGVGAFPSRLYQATAPRHCRDRRCRSMRSHSTGSPIRPSKSWWRDRLCCAKRSHKGRAPVTSRKLDAQVMRTHVQPG